MRTAPNKRGLTILALTTLLSLTLSTGAHAAPVKQIPADRLGHEVNLSKVDQRKAQETAKEPVTVTPQEEDLCTVASKDVCQAGVESGTPGGFSRPYGIASAPGGNLYVGDSNNHRVQEITPAGAFVLMFGKDVNETTGGDVCTEEEIKNTGVKCKTGVEGSGPGEFVQPASVAVDQSTGDVYVLDTYSARVEAFTPAGGFLLMLGKGVNATTGGDVCTAEEIKNAGVKCGPGIRNTAGGSEHAAFAPAAFSGNLLAVGGPQDLLYVGDEHRVQEFDPATGVWKREISLTAISSAPNSDVTALTVDPAGDTYLAYRVENNARSVRKFSPSGEQLQEIPIRQPRIERSTMQIDGLALDSENRLAVVEAEFGVQAPRYFGGLYDAGSGRVITEFAAQDLTALLFDGGDALYAAAPDSHEIVGYEPVPVAELSANAPVCKAGTVVGTNVTLDCVLEGEVNPEGVSETEAWFQWGGGTALEFETAKQPIAEKAPGEVVSIKAPVSGLRPNAPYFDRVDGYDQNVKAPELLTSERREFITSATAPVIVGKPDVSFVTSSSAVMSGELNPENAQTEYFFEYGAPAALTKCPGVRAVSCPGVTSTPALASAVYGEIGTTQEAGNLQASTEYGYRLAAVSESSDKTEKFETIATEEGVFNTLPAPAVSAVTGMTPSQITATSAVVSGTVNPGGRPASYVFELGLYNGAATQYGVVFSGATGAGNAPVTESLLLTGLQPGVKYSYRIKIEGGYGTATGDSAQFETLPVPELIGLPTPPAMLPTLPIAFPAEQASVSCKHGYTREKRGKCVKPRKRKAKARRKGTHGKKTVKRAKGGRLRRP